MTGTHTHVVYRKVFDTDNTLFVKEGDSRKLLRDEHVVFHGSERECREFVIREQHKASTPSLKRVLTPRPQ